MGRTFVTADMHGGHRALVQVLERADFKKDQDTLIVLGDTCDGWPEVRQCFDELLTIKDLIYVIGNHDEWTLNWFLRDERPTIWTSQGGQNTLKSYGDDPRTVPQSHIDLLKNSNLWYHDTENDRVFVHGGINKDLSLEKQKPDVCMWDRELYRRAYKKQLHNPMQKNLKVTDHNEVYIGHTTTQLLGNSVTPLNFCEVHYLDTGAGWSGKLTLMDVNTKDYWQSDYVPTLYPDEKGRY